MIELIGIVAIAAGIAGIAIATWMLITKRYKNYYKSK